MKLIALASVFALAASAASGAYFSDFESDDGGLTGTGDWQYGSPIGFDGAPYGGAEPVGGYSGDYCWGTIIGGAHNPGVDSYLTLAGQNLSLAETLTFWEFSESGSSDFDTAKVFVDGVEVYLSDGNSGLTWREVVIDLSGFSGTGDIVFEFHASTVVERVGWYVDDLCVTDIPAPGSAALLGLAGLVIRRRR